MNNKITSFRNFLVLFLFVSLFSFSANAQTVILSEDFASAASGDNVGTTQNTLWAGNANFSVDETNSKVYEAGGAVKLGTGSATGYILSAPLDLGQSGGNFTITFDVKGWTTVEGNIKITVTGLPEQIITYTALRTSPAFEAKTVSFTGGTANSTIRIETTAKRAFIDNVVVTVPEATTTLEAPVATAATLITNDGFTANWDVVTDATAYRLDVSTASDFSSFTGVYNDFAVSGTSQEVTGLTSNTTYYYRVRAIDADETSANSNVIAVITECGPFTLPDLTSGEYCPGSTVADLPLSGEEGYNWFADNTDTTPVAATEVLVHGTTYYLMQTINNCDSEKTPYVVNVVIVEAPVYAEPEIEVCHSGTIADITPENSTYQFYTTLTEGEALDAATPLVNGATLYVSRTVEGCESTRTEVLIEIEVPLIPVGEATQQFTEGQTLADLAVTADEDLVWYAEESLETELDPSTPLVDGTTYYAVNADAPCMSAPLAVTVQEALSSDAFGLAGLTVYPNPVNDVFTITYTEPVTNVTVYNMLGQVVINTTNNAATAQVNMSGFAAGTYMVKVAAGAQTANFKVVKQ